MGRKQGIVAVALAIAGMMIAGVARAPAQQLIPSLNKLENPICLKQGEETPEIYGPTDIGATLSNGRLSVAVNPEGTLSVFRWPSISYWEQLRYMTTDRDDPLLGTEPNEGAFSGLALRMKDGSTRTVWLREMRAVQRYRSAGSDTVVTRFSARNLGLRVEIVDVVPPRADALFRRHVLRLARRSPVRSAELIAFANLNPTASKRPILPTEDWCEELGGTDRARYDGAADAIVWSISELDQSTLERESVAVAIGASRRSSGHAVGLDRYANHPGGLLGDHRSAYDDAADGELSGRVNSGPAELDSALAVPIGRRPVTLTFAPGENRAQALATLNRYRLADARREAKRKRRWYSRFLRRAPLPDGAPRSIVRLARRALVSLRQVIDTNSGENGNLVSIAASLSTQSPYFVDWIRDGAFFNEVLDTIGRPGLVERHNGFYVEVQAKQSEGAPPGTPVSFCEMPTPSGNWFMTNYADGVPAGTFTWEIDEAAFGLWALWRHAEWLGGKPRRIESYLRKVYPAIRRTGEFLVAYRDPQTGLTPGLHCEDDNFPQPGQPTMHASGPVLLALRSAERAARRLGRSADEERYARRRAEVERGIDRHHRGPGGSWTGDFGDGGWALWPIRVEPYGTRRSRAQAEVAWQKVKPSFEAPNGEKVRGQYEVKALHGLAHAYRATTPRKLRRVRRGLRWIAEVQAAWQKTGILGEAWYVRDGKVASVVAQPHVWEQALVYLAALRAYGKRDYTPGGTRSLLEPPRR